MKHPLLMKFVVCYIVLGILSFFLVTAGGSYLAEKWLERSVSEKFYQEAHNIASDETLKYNISTSNLDSIRENLVTVATYQQTTIWIINSKGQIILSTYKDITPDSPVDIEDFDPTAWGSSYYQVGDFFGYFSSDRLSVIVPITADMTTKGYVAIHYLMRSLYQTRSELLMIMQIIFLAMYGLSFLVLLLYYHHVHLPLREIMKGTSEYAAGNLSYQISVKSEDEMGYLSNMLNYMSDKLNRNGEYQRNFISNISHDFRSPLTSIKGYVEAMLDGTIPPEMQEKYLKVIAFEADRLEKLTRSLLTLNELDIQKRMLRPSRFDINETIKTTAAAFDGICREKEILLELILCGRELFVYADMEQIQQVLYNLLDNAIKFSPSDSSIVLETTEKNGKIFVSVKDHGTGIPAESLSKIWDRFYKTDTSRGKDRKGTGLGLSIVKEIINAHEQHINVISTVGVGTEFIFTLEKAK